MKMIRIVCILLTLSLLTACVSVNISPGVAGRGEPQVFTFDVGEITDIRVELYCDIQLHTEPSDKVTLEIQPNLMEYVTVTESGGVLTVRSARNITWSNRAAVLTVSTPVLETLSFAGAGTVTSNDTITADTFTLRLDGAGKGVMKLDVDRLNLHMAGAGDFTLSGSADTADINMAGAGTVEALSLQTRETSITIAGVGTVRIDCTERLKITAGGVGTVEHTGGASVDSSRGGLVSIRRLD
jgi:hypothetical protein